MTASAHSLVIAFAQAKETEIDSLQERLNDGEDVLHSREADLEAARAQLAELQKKLEGDTLSRAKDLEASDKRLRAQLEELQLKLDEVCASLGWT